MGQWLSDQLCVCRSVCVCVTWSSCMSWGRAPGIWMAIFTMSFCCGMLPWPHSGCGIKREENRCVTFRFNSANVGGGGEIQTSSTSAPEENKEKAGPCSSHSAPTG